MTIKTKGAPGPGESMMIDECKDAWTCPVHGIKVTVMRRKVSTNDGDDMGTQGAFYGCKKYGECGYYITTDLKRVARSKIIASNEQ